MPRLRAPTVTWPDDEAQAPGLPSTGQTAPVPSTYIFLAQYPYLALGPANEPRNVLSAPVTGAASAFAPDSLKGDDIADEIR